MEELLTTYELDRLKIEVKREFLNEGKSFVELLLDLYDEKLQCMEVTYKQCFKKESLK